MRETCNASSESAAARSFSPPRARCPWSRSRAAQAQAKIAQTAVHYQTTPGKDGHQCDGCNFFVAPNSCKMVDGDIAPTGWCALSVKKAPA